MKKLLLLLLLLTALCFFAACTDSADDGKLDIVCSVFPEYDWTKAILGEASDGVRLHLLVANGVDMHSYQPSVDDMVAISECDLLIYVGGASDAWIEEALANKKNPQRRVLRLLDHVECADGACHGGEEHRDHTHEAEGYDEHVWLSLRNASKLSRVIADELQNVDPENEAVYEANAQAYIGKLTALDEEYAQVFSSASKKVLLFADRFPFVYLSHDYDLTCFAAFSGCSAEIEASADTVRALAEKVDLYELSVVFVLEDSVDSIAETVISATKAKNARILTVDSMQSIGWAEIRQGVSYLSVMEKNLSVFRDALQSL